MEVNKLTAREAAKIADDSQKNMSIELEKKLDAILFEIKKKASVGEKKLISDSLSGFGGGKIKKALEDLGYSVTVYSDQRDGDWSEIFWVY